MNRNSSSSVVPRRNAFDGFEVKKKFDKDNLLIELEERERGEVYARHL